ncbi:aldehyde ferredoxin oxidoreductase N-terminal domain-containing protein [Methanospirillum stamsii]|uniref:Aldehyde:ferredoxin oxidoreductase n=1 Tax=Methanospirillum stamsii TaxID=1277351 RepID=A0A2V2N5N5_9EURY|nr:aldehyde ferredoxin oxidoreductase N-terminal domain-containing protein [Methanospirillum stamsii]PWR71818.1 aldehyde:ferredoxin oxidoreductase [Methanospirillum stamsii]
MINDALLSKILVINLSKWEYHTLERPELFRERLGGAGVAIRLLDEFCPEGADPLGPENPIILSVGAVTSLFPLASKCVAMFKSPLTGNLGESHGGGRTPFAIRSAGYGAIVITGAASHPVYLSITKDGVAFRDARALWGTARSDTVARIIRSKDGTPGARTILRIGRAGENLVRFANVTSETYRHFGRMGLGAVFGSKKLKAVLVSGDELISVSDQKKYREVYDTLYEQVTKSSLMQKYHEIGTPVNVKSLSAMGSLPVKNLTEQRLDNSDNLSGEEFARLFLSRRVACSHCPVSCIHIGQIRIPYPNDPYFFKTIPVSYDYELIYSLGFMLGVSDPQDVLMLIDSIEQTGLDAMSAGVCAAWATEAMQNGIIGPQETGVNLKFGDTPQYLQFFELLAGQSNQFYRDIGKGAEYAASQYGGTQYALSFGKNEMPGYHTGPATYIGYICGARHSHLDNAGYSIDQKPVEKSPGTPEEIAEELYHEEAYRQILSSLVVCFFARGLYSREVIREVLSISGIDMTIEELDILGRDILYEKYLFKLREGFSLEPDKVQIPSRIFELSSGKGMIREEEVRRGVARYKSLLEEKSP